MTVEDIEFAVQLTNLEEWDYTPGDFRRFMRMDPRGTLVAWEDRRPVGVATATTYGEAAWIGSIVVDPHFRGRGYGKALVKEALRYVEDEGGETCWLNAYGHAQSFYEQLGFQAAGSTIHLQGSAQGKVRPGARLAHAGDLDRVAEFDAPFFGADRRKVLDEFYHDFGESFFLWCEDGVTGFIVGAPYPGGVEVSPWVCDPTRSEVAEQLLLHLLAHYPETSVSLNMPEENSVGVEMMESLGFSQGFKTVRMYRGAGGHSIDPAGIFSLGGLEKG